MYAVSYTHLDVYKRQVLHMEKAHGSDSGTTAHIERFIIPKNADPTRTHLNRKLIEYPEGVKGGHALFRPV